MSHGAHVKVNHKKQRRLYVEERLQVYIPAKFGSLFLAMPDIAPFHYKQTGYFDRESQLPVKWDDSQLIYSSLSRCRYS